VKIQSIAKAVMITGNGLQQNTDNFMKLISNDVSTIFIFLLTLKNEVIVDCAFHWFQMTFAIKTTDRRNERSMKFCDE